MICADCKQPADELNEADQCEDCYEQWFQREKAYWYPLYLGEKQAGLLDQGIEDD